MMRTLALGGLILLSACAGQVVTESTVSPPVLHVVLLQFKPEVSADQRTRALEQSIARLQAIPGVLAVDAGPKVRDDRPIHVRDYHGAILVRLADEAALDGYGPHPLHQAFLQEFQPLFDSVRVIDFAALPLAP
jgi:hypothetical protein